MKKQERKYENKTRENTKIKKRNMKIGENRNEKLEDEV